MPEWLKLKNLPGAVPHVPVPSVRLDVVVSPYEVPEAVRGFKIAKGRFRIEFRYIDGPEPEGVSRSLDEHVKAIEGRHSRRLLALEIDVDALGAEAVGLSISTSPSLADVLREQLETALERAAAQQAEEEHKSINYARSAVKLREKELLQQLTSA
ncbi:MAG: hypothetical protein ACF8R7_14155 [Phycisphaerales bacterium JB039]